MSNKAVDTNGTDGAGKQRTMLNTDAPRRCRHPERHRKLSGHEKRRYLSNVTECNIFRAKPIFDKTNFQRTREPRPNYVRRRSSYARRKRGEYKIPTFGLN